MITKAPHCKVRRSATYNPSPVSGSFNIPWDTEEYDTDNFFDIANPTYLTIPIAGLYAIALEVSYLPQTTIGTFGFAAITIDDNGNGTADRTIASECWDQIVVGTTQSLNVFAIDNLQAGARIYALCQQGGGTSSYMRGDIPHQSTFMTVAKLDKLWS